MIASGEVSHVITIGEEITGRVEANRAVARAEKLAAIGRLAAGVVHEINNPLATISACAEALESRVSEGAFNESAALDDLREYLGLIRSEAFRCKTITNGLLDFSRTRATEHALVNLGDVISSAARLVSHQQRGEKVEFQIETPENLPPISGDAGQLQQAVIALATNAIDAMPEGGVLRITSQQKWQAACWSKSATPVSAFRRRILPKIFEPFFTTKEVGKGTGLGLAVCYGILTEHGGSLDVQSTVGVGTTFTISLPAINQRRRAAGLSEQKAARILIAEDEANLRMVLQKELERLGYRVQAAPDGEAALRKLEESNVDVLLCDINMPRIDGMEVLRRVHERPNPPEVIMLTGQATVETAVEAMKLGAYDYLTKPYSITELDVRVKQAAEKRRLRVDNLRLREQLARQSGLPEIVSVSDGDDRGGPTGRARCSF